MAEELQIRLHGDPSGPVLVYLPGLHGDWTLIGGLRKELGQRVHFAEITYPRTLDWSLDDYAAGIEAALSQQGIQHGWLLGESFGSQVLWAMMARGHFRCDGIILAGGFVQHPARWAARIAGRIAGGIPLSLFIGVMFGYSKVARYRFRHSPEVMAGVQEFIERRTELDRKAATHRLRLVAANNPCSIAGTVNVPVYALTGFLDPIVPWFLARRWLKRHCPALRQYRIIWKADHNVLSTAPFESADQIVRWMRQG